MVKKEVRYLPSLGKCKNIVMGGDRIHYHCKDIHLLCLIFLMFSFFKKLFLSDQQCLISFFYYVNVDFIGQLAEYYFSSNLTFCNSFISFFPVNKLQVTATICLGFYARRPPDIVDNWYTAMPISFTM